MSELRIVAAAVCRNGVILTRPAPARHHHLVSELHMMKLDAGEWEQGFLSSTGEFLSRWKARQLAMQNGQCEKPKGRHELFSEDVW